MKISPVDGNITVDSDEEITINGTRYSGVFFQEFGCSFSNMVGQVLKVIRKESGMLTVQRVRELEGTNEI